MLLPNPYNLYDVWRSKTPLIVIAAMSLALVIAACGSSKDPGSSGKSPSHPQFLAFSACMRSHGVTNFPDPSASGGIQLSSSSGINPFSPSFKAAQAKCSKLLPGGGPANHPPSEQDKQQALHVSQCMREHGITGFPDPTTTPPSSPAGYSAILDRNGVVFALPDSVNPQSPAFQQAGAACGFPAGPHK